jgi:D-3-phosphoglycerate dehydrogenase
MKYKVVSMSGIAGDRREDLSRIDAQLSEALLSSEEDIIKEASDADAVIVGPNEPYSFRVIQTLTKCKVISRAGIGYNNIDLAAATEYGIPVAYVPDASTIEVSDHALALLLSFSRNLIPINKVVKAGAWQLGRNEIPSLMRPIRRLSEQTLGLCGLGRIGKAVCKKARSFGMRILVYDPYIPLETAKEIGAKNVSFEELLGESDYISLHAALTPETRHVFGLEQFKRLKPTAYIINTARGGLIDETALAVAISEGYIAGAGLDVMDPEPPKPDNPLIKMENAIITGHTAFYSEKSVSELRRCAVEAVVAALTGHCPSSLANPTVIERANYRLGIKR